MIMTTERPYRASVVPDDAHFRIDLYASGDKAPFVRRHGDIGSVVEYFRYSDQIDSVDIAPAVPAELAAELTRRGVPFSINPTGE